METPGFEPGTSRFRVDRFSALSYVPTQLSQKVQAKFKFKKKPLNHYFDGFVSN